MFASDMFLADRPLHDKSPYPLSRIQQLELCEQVHQAVAGRRARRPHYIILISLYTKTEPIITNRFLFYRCVKISCPLKVQKSTKKNTKLLNCHPLQTALLCGFPDSANVTNNYGGFSIPVRVTISTAHIWLNKAFCGLFFLPKF